MSCSSSPELSKVFKSVVVVKLGRIGLGGRTQEGLWEALNRERQGFHEGSERHKQSLQEDACRIPPATVGLPQIRNSSQKSLMHISIYIDFDVSDQSHSQSSISYHMSQSVSSIRTIYTPYTRTFDVLASTREVSVTVAKYVFSDSSRLKKSNLSRKQPSTVYWG